VEPGRRGSGDRRLWRRQRYARARRGTAGGRQREAASRGPVAGHVGDARRSGAAVDGFCRDELLQPLPRPSDHGFPAPFAYRAYPGGVYLGVVVTDGTAYTYGGVYAVGILGGTLAHPAYVGQLTSFITPVVAGGGGTGTGNGCFDLSLADVQGTHTVIGYTYSGAITGTETVDTTVGAVTTFEGHTARQTALITTGSHTASGQTVAINTNGTTYSARTGDGQMTQYGLQTVATGSAGGFSFTTTIKTVYSPPFVDNQYSLAIGGSVTQSLAGSATTTIHTGFGPDQVNTSAIPASTSTTTYVGQESVSVIAGTYSACKYQVTTAGSSDVSTSWFIVGKGIPVKTTISGSVSQTIEANSVVLNGAHL
jgi:hypothetical protein